MNIRENIGQMEVCATKHNTLPFIKNNVKPPSLFAHGSHEVEEMEIVD